MKLNPVLVVMATAGSAMAAAPSSTPTTSSCQTACETSCHTADASSAMARAAAYRLIELQTFNALPEGQRAIIAEKLTEMGVEVPGTAEQVEPEFYAERNAPLTAEEFDAAWERVKDFTSREAFENFKPIHQRMVASFAEVAPSQDVKVMPCFAPGTDEELIVAFENIVFGAQLPDGFDAFQPTTRWGPTALRPSGSTARGTPTILTYSFPDDGVNIPNGVGEGAGPNALNSFLDGIYGNRATWRAIYDDIFARWGELSGVTYVLEPNDDNVSLFNSPGVAGVRGDLRMGGKPIDGNSGTLAYNFFPQNGDMVIDTADNFYFSTASNSQRLRNILWHEHGHGMGQLHVCPVNGTKLMEPFINLSFTGPQFDDIIHAQWHYGDNQEPNNSVGEAAPLGSFSAGSSVSLDEVSLANSGDTDFYGITTVGLTQINATLRPIGFNYLNGPQVGNCNTGAPYNPREFQNLAIAVIDSSGTIVASADATGLGANETISVAVLPGDYSIRISGSQAGGATEDVQAYELDVAFGVATGIPPQFVSPVLPAEAAPGVPSPFSIEVSPGTDTIVSGPFLNIRAAGEATFTQTPLDLVAGDIFLGTIPGFNCDEDPEFFLSVIGQDAGEVRFPASSEAVVEITDGEVIALADDAETDIGWSISGNITSDLSGRWERGLPQGNDRGDPADDADGSGRAWLTGINANDNSDVDDGETILTSPAFETNANSTISYAYWFNDIAGGPINGDSYVVSVSENNGSSFNVVRTYTSAAGTWRNDTLVAGVDFNASSQTVLRVSVNDFGAQNVVEGGFDALTVASSTCTPIVDDCVADVNGDGELNGLDFGAWLGAFNAGDPAADQNGDNEINGLDFGAWLSNFNAGCD